MAFFCTKTGVRIVAPGVCSDVDKEGGVPTFVESETCVAAEHAALAALRSERLSETEASPSASAEDRARAAAKKALAPTDKPKTPAAKPDDEPSKGGRRPARPEPVKPDAPKPDNT
jgi:hypothetical protein